jgi:hypothetical protein
MLSGNKRHGQAVQPACLTVGPGLVERDSVNSAYQIDAVGRTANHDDGPFEQVSRRERAPEPKFREDTSHSALILIFRVAEQIDVSGKPWFGIPIKGPAPNHEMPDILRVQQFDKFS